MFLRWNHGQELRQALITLAISVILADQILAHAGGLAESMAWPKGVTHFTQIFGQRYATSRLFVLAIALVVGGALWLWLNRTRMGIVIRAGVADEQMVRALGISIGIVFAITFFVGSFLAGMGGVMVASFAGVSTGADGQWLLHSLVVVISADLVRSVAPSPAWCCTGWSVPSPRVPAPGLHLLLDHLHLRTARHRPGSAALRSVRARSERVFERANRQARSRLTGAPPPIGDEAPNDGAPVSERPRRGRSAPASWWPWSRYWW